MMTGLASRLLAVCAFSLTLGGCATTMPYGEEGRSADGAERPMLDRSPASQSEARAKINVELGTAYLEVGRFDIALDEARAALEHQAGYPPAFHLMGLVHMYVGDDNAARINFERALRGAPRDPDFNNSYGWFLCGTGNEQEGLQRLAVAARNPYYRHPTRAHANAGLCNLRIGERDAAREHFARAVNADPSNVQALYHLAEIDYERGNYPAARTSLVRLHQQVEPTAASAWLGLRTERKLGNREAEASYAEQLRGRFGDSAEVQLLRQGAFE